MAYLVADLDAGLSSGCLGCLPIWLQIWMLAYLVAILDAYLSRC
jgi:uncharacterized membrane protein